MSMTTHRQPSHCVYAVERSNSRNASWMPIGSAFSHRDGKGFDLELNTMPLGIGELILRPRAEKRLPDGSIVRPSVTKRVASRGISTDRTSSLAA